MAKARPRISGPVRCEVLQKEDAAGVESLAAFCCGHCGLDPSAAEVNATAAQLYCGGDPQAGGSPVYWVVLLRAEDDALLGIAGVTLKAPNLGDASFLQVYGREKRLKGNVLANRRTTLGEALVRASIELSAQRTPGPDALDIYAFTHLDNYTSHKVLKRAGFKLVKGTPVVGGVSRYALHTGELILHAQQLWHRPAGPPPEPLPPDVYLGPKLPPGASA